MTATHPHRRARRRRWLEHVLSRVLRSVHPDPALEASLDEARDQIEQLRASRARLAAAADAERRRIERDLHDNAQQHLVALAVNLQLARELTDADPAGAKTLLAEMGRDVREALDEVRELAQGIYPPLLRARGLAEALRGMASAAGIPTRVEATGLGRYPPDVEATVYFSCREALQNAAHHAGAGARASIRAWHEGGALHFEVLDDGAGFEQRTNHPGVGLTNMSDRLGVLGGRLAITSEPHRGTRVSGTIPITT